MQISQVPEKQKTHFLIIQKNCKIQDLGYTEYPVSKIFKIRNALKLETF